MLPQSLSVSALTSALAPAHVAALVSALASVPTSALASALAAALASVFAAASERFASLVSCAGSGERGQLGHGDLENHKSPTPILGGFGSSSEGVEIGCIAAGEAHSIAAAKNGTRVWAWGTGHYGQLGVGGLEPRLSPTEIADLADQKITQVSICL